MAKKFNLDSSFILAVAYIIVGVLFMVFKGTVVQWVMTAIGIFTIVQGVLDVLKGNLVGGIVSVAIGVVILVFGWLIQAIALIVLGVCIAANGVKAILSGDKDLASLAFNGATIVIGVLLVVSKWVVMDVFFVIIGALFIINGALSILGLKK